MKSDDLKQKCSRAMLESGPDVMVSLHLPLPEDLEPGQKAVDLGLDQRRGGPMARVVGTSDIDGKKMMHVHVKAASLLAVLNKVEP